MEVDFYDCQYIIFFVPSVPRLGRTFLKSSKITHPDKVKLELGIRITTEVAKKPNFRSKLVEVSMFTT